MPAPPTIPRRVHRIAGRLLMTAGLVGAAVFVGSVFYNAGYSTGSRTLYLQNGCAILASFPAELGDTSLNWPHNPYVNRNHTEPVDWLRFEFRRRVSSRVAVVQSTVPLWTVPAVCLVSGVALLTSGNRPRRWFRQGRCLRCGYDLKATGKGGPCPECGVAS